MSGKLIIQAAAEADLEEQAAYLADRNLEAALRFAIAAQGVTRVAGARLPELSYLLPPDG